MAVDLWLETFDGASASTATVTFVDAAGGTLLRVANVNVPADGGPVRLAVDPELSTLAEESRGSVLLEITAAPGSTPIGVGMTLNDSYPPGGSFIGGEPNWPGQARMRG